MSRLDQLRHRYVANGTLAAVAMQDLQFETLLVPPARSQTQGLLSLLEQHERFIPCWGSRRRRMWARKKLDEENPFLIVPSGDPTFPQRAGTTGLKDHKDREGQSRCSLRRGDF